MESLVAGVDGFRFDIEVALDMQLGAVLIPFAGMDKSTTAVCDFFPAGSCQRGANCPFRHVMSDRTIVCKHWLRGLCKKGDQCEFLHEFDMTKMPECFFYNRFKACHNKECPFLHIDPESKIKDCPWYDRGFCRHGPSCRHRHVRRVLCINYLAGLCPDGPSCKYMHPRFELPVADDTKMKQRVFVCHLCGDFGHKAAHCLKVSVPKTENADGSSDFPPGEGQQSVIPMAVDQIKEESSGMGNPNFPPPYPAGIPQPLGQSRGFGYNFRPQGPFRAKQFLEPKRPLDEVTCFKCSAKGHYANKCPKGHLAFLSHHHQNTQPDPV